MFAASGASALAAGWMWPLQALAAKWNKSAFDARALERLTREVAAVSGVDEAGAQKKVDDVLLSRAA